MWAVNPLNVSRALIRLLVLAAMLISDAMLASITAAFTELVLLKV